MPTPVKYDIDELKKVVVIDSSEQEDEDQDEDSSSQGGGAGGQSAPDVEIVDIADEGDESDNGDQEEDGNGDEGGGKKGKGKKKGADKKGSEGGDDEGEGEGDEQEGAGGDKKGKSGKGSKGKPSQSKGGGGGSSGPPQDIDDIIKKSEDLLKEIEDNRTGKHSCGSDQRRQEKQVTSGSPEDADRRRDKYREAIDKIQEKIQEAEERGIPNNPYGGYARGEGKEGAPSEYTPLPMEKPRPAFLDEIMDFAEKGYQKDYTKKGTDWLYSEAFDYDVFFKDRPKVAVPGKWLFLMVDCSGSMLGDFDGNGKSLLEHLVAYLPTIARDFEGEIWWVSDGIITFPDGELGRQDLSQFRNADIYDLQKLYDNVVSSKNFGGGTTFAVELQAAVKIREEEGHDAAIVLLTDSYIDSVQTKYIWKGEHVTGQLPPNTVIMTNTAGKKYMDDNYRADMESDKKIEIYDITEDGEYSY